MVPIPEGQAIVICPFCDLRSMVKGERGIRRHQVTRRVTRAQAELAMRQFLSGTMQIARNASGKAEVQEAFLAYLPFWSSWTRVLGWVFGQKEVGSGDDKRLEPREIKIAQEMNWNGVALDVGEFGVQRISLAKRELAPFNRDELHSSGMVFEPVGSMSDASEQAASDFFSRVREMADLDLVSQTFVRYSHQRFGLVYYPLWVIRYLYRGRAFQVVVDGHTGEVLYGKAPGSTLFRAAALVGGMALGALIGVDGSALAFYLGLNSDDDGIGLMLAGGFVALAGGFGIMTWAYNAFRYGEQYEFNGHREIKRRTRRKGERGVQRVLEETL
jgi:hypothetical protein